MSSGIQSSSLSFIGTAETQLHATRCFFRYSEPSRISQFIRLDFLVTKGIRGLQNRRVSLNLLSAVLPGELRYEAFKVQSYPVLAARVELSLLLRMYNIRLKRRYRMQVISDF